MNRPPSSLSDPGRQPNYRRVLEVLACPACGGALVERREPVRSHACWRRAPGEDRHQQSRLASFVSVAAGGGPVLDLGSGARRLSNHVVAVDICPLPGLDLVADGHRLPFRSGTVGRIVCTGVLEHVEEPTQVVAEMARVLRPAGRVYIAVPFMQGFHPGGGTQQDFQRYTHVGLLRLLSPFRITEWGISGGPSATLAWILREYLALAFGWNRVLYRMAYAIAGPLTSWLHHLDVLLDRFPQANRIACGFYVIGEKVGGPLSRKSPVDADPRETP